MRGRKEKLTEEQKFALVEKARHGCPSATLCEEFGISRPVALKILRENNIVRKTGRPFSVALYYTCDDPVITLEPESFEYVKNELKLQGIDTAYKLWKKCESIGVNEITESVAKSFFNYRRLKKTQMEKIFTIFHLVVSLNQRVVTDPFETTENTVKENEEKQGFSLKIIENIVCFI